MRFGEIAPRGKKKGNVLHIPEGGGGSPEAARQNRF